MKVVVLAGGVGSRLAEETEVKPKPMVEIGGYPILWHILTHYSHFDFNDFYIALGYKGDYIKRYFAEYWALQGDMTISLSDGKVTAHQRDVEPWTVHLKDTGRRSMTGGRLLRLQPYVGDDTFMLTYGDGVSNVDLRKLLEFHKRQGKIATVTAVRPPARFGRLEFDGDLVRAFFEKPQLDEGWINGGFMVMEPEAFKYLKDDQSSLENDVLALAAIGELAAFRHSDFWQCMDTLRDKKYLEQAWQSGAPPWRLS